ncbi:hypothetical protein EW026_g809 [Hermanssonia centrifuga]|uniref:F-box domain-containing protein n=1 Tax=Hermanssonia centrifuga TaxID=98765 RepID=A0A4S4KTH0_9APHY|nr:hypothetical protein EW026_g809 [Hermanssonia centrifuga]
MSAKRRKTMSEAELDVSQRDDDASTTSNASEEITHNNIPPLASIPPELFDEIMSYFPILPLTWYYGTSPTKVPDLRFFERTYILRVLSLTCKALRRITLPRLWSRLDTCCVPENWRRVWYKYVMQALKRKADGVAAADPSLRVHVRTLAIELSKFEYKNILPSIPKLLLSLPSLHTIQILNLSTPDAGSLIRACPNVTHVRCAEGTGIALIGALKHCKCEVLDGMIDWVKEPKLMQRLVNSAPKLATLEMRHPVRWGTDPDYLNLSTYIAPAKWAQIIPTASGLKNLRTFILTFATAKEAPSDIISVAAAREVLMNSALPVPKKLVVRRILPPHYAELAPPYVVVDEELMSSVTEIITPSGY